MFKEVSKSRAARLLVTRADVVGDVDLIGRRMLIFRENDTQAIGEFIFFEGNSDAIGRLSGGGVGRPYLRLSNRARSDKR